MQGCNSCNSLTETSDHLVHYCPHQFWWSDPRCFHGGSLNELRAKNELFEPTADTNHHPNHIISEGLGKTVCNLGGMAEISDHDSHTTYRESSSSKGK
jgi:hypothetical protein